MLKLKVILGSTRPNRISEKFLPWIKIQLAQKPEFEVEVIDLRDYPMPLYDQPLSPSMVKDGAYQNEIVRSFAEKIKEADAFLIISPEYNHSVSAVLKNALDSVYAEWNNKAIAFVAYGSVGGARAVEHLRNIAVELQMAPTRSAVHIPMPWLLLDENKNLKPEALNSYNESLKMTLGQLSWWGNALKVAREK